MDAGSAGTIYSLANQSLMHAVTNQQQQSQSNNPGITNDHSTAATFNSLAVIEHLQQSLRQEQTRRNELEKELINERQKFADLQRQMLEDKNVQQKTQELQRIKLDSVKQRLMISLKASMNASDKCGQLSWDETPSMFKHIEYLHECDECTFKTKSDVSLILHKMNHMITEQQYLLSTSSFTTRNSNSKSIYQCSACDIGSLTRHQVYRHIYDVHTMERPLSCPYCELSFTHKDYLEQHIPTKHDKVPGLKLTSNLCNVLSSSSISLDSSSTHLSLSPSASNKMDLTNNSNPKSSKSNRGRPSSSSTMNRNISQTDLKCTFPDCNFITIFPDKLDFHMKAHVNTKYKCPYCPYVSNTIIDIKRHIQKSKKHEGMKMYSCQKCSYAADCDRSFKEHLRAYHFGYEAHDTVIDYFIEEMFSNKNKRTDEEDNNPIAEANNNVAIILSSNGTNSSGTLTHSTTTTTTIQNVGGSHHTTDTTTPPPPKKIAGVKNQHSRLINIDNQQQQAQSRQQRNQSQMEQTNPYRSGTSTNNHQTLNLHIPSTANQNSLAMYHDLELAAVAAAASVTDPVTFSTNTNPVSGNQRQQQPNITSIPISAVTMAHHQHPHHIAANIHHHQQHGSHQSSNHQQQQNSSAETTLLSMPENFVQAALAATVQQVSTSSNHSNNNTGGSSADTSGTGGIPATISQYISYANY